MLYRLTSTKYIKQKSDGIEWGGFCVVVKIRFGRLVFPNGESYPYKWKFGKACILSGPHRGKYDLRRVPIY